jgi:hypothetical protein
MAQDNLQLQRLELKYQISEQKALAIRDFVRSYLVIDEYSADKPNYSYRIHSLYLDSDDLRTYWETINGVKNRFKLRLRYYDDLPGSPVFFEIKRRMNEAIMKQRGGVRREAVGWLLGGQLPEPEHMLTQNTRHFVALQNFSRLMLSIGASPKAHVTYFREAWVSTHDNSIRVTMDRNVYCSPEFGCALGTELVDPVKPFGHKVILELKFTGRFPNWFRDLVEAFDLMRGAAAKYADGVALIGESFFARRTHDMAGGPAISTAGSRLPDRGSAPNPIVPDPAIPAGTKQSGVDNHAPSGVNPAG